ALPDLLHPDHEAIPVVPVAAHGDVEVEAIVEHVGVIFAHVVPEPRRSQDGPRAPELERPRLRQDADTLHAIDEDAVSEEDLLGLEKDRVDLWEDGEDIFFEVLGRWRRHPADSTEAMRQPRPGLALENIPDPLAHLDEPKEGREGA